MPCVCEQCLQHSRTLGLSDNPPSEAAIHKAYRETAKLWHPDRFQNDPRLQPEAEEHFKRVQIAYRELAEHYNHPAELPPQTIFAKPATPPPISFGNAPGCYTTPHIPLFVEQIIAGHLGPANSALAIVDLSSPGSQTGASLSFFSWPAMRSSCAMPSTQSPSSGIPTWGKST